jgi:hypothetical protein
MTNTDVPSPTGAGTAEIGRASVWMTRALALFLGAYALFSGWTLLYNLSFIAVATACVLGWAAVGLWLMRPWSRWIVYALSAVVCVWFAWYVSRLVRAGWPYDDATRSVVTVFPASLLLLGAIAAAALVRSVFKLR